MKLTLTGRIGAADELLDTDLRGLAILQGDGGSFVYAATGPNGGISVYRIDAGGGLAALSDSAYFSVSGIGAGRLAAVTLDGQAQLILTGAGALVRHDLGPDGALGAAATIDLPGQAGATHAALAAHDLTGGLSALYTVETATGALAGWLSDGAGAVRLAGKARDFELAGEVTLANAVAGDTPFLLAADAGGVHAYRIGAASGTLTATGSLGSAEGLGIAQPTAIDTVSAFGATWVVLAAAGSQSLSVMKLSAAGGLSPADHVLDTLATRFGAVSALEVVKVAGHVLVLAGGGDDGISLFTLAPGGQLVHLQSLAHDTGLGLENVSAIAARPLGDTLQIFVTSAATGGISQFALDIGSLGAVIRPPADGAARGTDAGDLLLARGAQGTLIGGDGDDILVAGSRGGVLTGGAGADTFVLCPAEKVTEVADFEAGTDRLDLSHFPMLRGTGQLKVTDRADGILLEYGDTAMRILSADGGALDLADLFPGGLTTPDRVPFPKGPVGRFAAGTRRDDDMAGGAGTDIMRGRGGDDTMTGGTGDDALRGNGGDDRLSGEAGADALKGQGGADRLSGGAGRDVLAGGKGRDRLSGDAGDDTLKGGGGADQFRFAQGHGDDRIAGFKPGQDVIWLATGVAEFAALDIRAAGGDTVIDTGAGTITLTGVAAGDLSAEDVLFG